MTDKTGTDPEAPYGRRKDGRPKKRPGRKTGLPNNAVFRERLTSKYIREMKRTFDTHGESAMKAVAQSHPEKFLQLMAQLVPKQAEVKTEDVTERPALSTIDLANQLAGIIARAGEGAGGVPGSGKPEDMDTDTRPPDGSVPH